MHSFGPSVELSGSICPLQICHQGDSTDFILAINALDDNSNPISDFIVVGYLSTNVYQGFLVDVLYSEKDEGSEDEEGALELDATDKEERDLKCLLRSLAARLESRIVNEVRTFPQLRVNI